MPEQKGFEQKFYSVNSISTQGVQVRRYLDFVERFGQDRSPFPYSSERVALYAMWLARKLTYRAQFLPEAEWGGSD